MDASVNLVVLVGRLGADPDLRYLRSGGAVCNLRVATSRRHVDDDGEAHERTEWSSVVVWGKTAEWAAENLSQGDQVYVEGSLSTRSWEHRAHRDVTCYKTEVNARTVQLVAHPRAARPEPSPRQVAAGVGTCGVGAPGGGNGDDDIPI